MGSVGQCMGSVWVVYEQCMDKVVIEGEQVEGSVWAEYGQCMHGVYNIKGDLSSVQCGEGTAHELP